MEPVVDADVLAHPGVEKVEWVTDLAHVEPLILQQVLLELVSAWETSETMPCTWEWNNTNLKCPLTCHLDLLDDPDKHGPGILGQLLDDSCLEFVQVNLSFILYRDGDHAGAAVRVGYLDAVGGGHIGRLVKDGADYALHFVGGDILPLPTEMEINEINGYIKR